MQEDDIRQDDGATTHTSTSRDKDMNGKRKDARRMADDLIAEEKQRSQVWATRSYFIAVIIGLVFWTIVYFIWRSL